MATVRRGRQAVDIGPATATASGLAAIGRLSSLKVSEYLQADDSDAAGAGPIFRRPATAEELARLGDPTPRRPAPNGVAMHLLRPAAATVATSRERGAARTAAIYAARRAARQTA